MASPDLTAGLPGSSQAWPHSPDNGKSDSPRWVLTTVGVLTPDVCSLAAVGGGVQWGPSPLGGLVPPECHEHSLPLTLRTMYPERSPQPWGSPLLCPFFLHPLPEPKSRAPGPLGLDFVSTAAGGGLGGTSWGVNPVRWQRHTGMGLGEGDTWTSLGVFRELSSPKLTLC